MRDISQKSVRRIVGLMSGTSVDGIDAALVELSGPQDAPEVRLLAFEDRPFPQKVRAGIFELFDQTKATVDRVGKMSYILGGLYAEAVLSVVKAAGLSLRMLTLLPRTGRPYGTNLTRPNTVGCPRAALSKSARAL